MQWLKAITEMKLPPLIAGKHPDGPEHGLCAMEMVAFMEGLPHSDSPECTCPVLRSLTIMINDMMPDNDRQKLMPILPSLVDTVVGPAAMQDRENHIMRTAMQTAEWYHRDRYSEYDYERDRFRGTRHAAYYGNRIHHEIEQYMRDGLSGAVKLITKFTPPWQVADVLIALLRDTIKIGSPKPKIDFRKNRRVKKLAEVVYLRNTKGSHQQMKQYMPMPSFAAIDPKKGAGVIAWDCAV